MDHIALENSLQLVYEEIINNLKSYKLTMIEQSNLKPQRILNVK